jgi:hypothetical protein
MDVLDIEVDTEELEQFYEEECVKEDHRECTQPSDTERKPWCEKGMECEVPECGPLGKFLSFRKYMRHWSKVHKKNVQLYKCSLCGKQFSIHSKGKRHIGTHGGQRGILVEIDIPNRFFINPGVCTPYRLAPEQGHTQDLEERKREAQRKRREQVRDLFAVPAIPEEHRTNCRDEALDIFPGETEDSYLLIKSLVDRGNKKVDSVVMEKTCVIPEFETFC